MSVTEEIKARLDVVSFLSQYIHLKKAGRNYTALCPFHNEKTPSFVVFPESQNWRCFGACGEGGDIFNFVMKHDGLDFASALKLLADKAGVQLQERSPEQVSQDEHLDKLRGLLDETAKFFHERLLKGADAQQARAYAKKRGLTLKTLTDFRIGYAPGDWRQALDHLMQLGYSEHEIIQAGVALHNEERNSVYDRFRNRLVIPICDGHGQVIGFGARALNPDDNPKYLNSPQTALFDKSATLFGLHVARRTIRESETAVIVEGYMDAIQAHQAGFSNVLAQMGTALTELQLKQISRYARRLILALDPDAAGVQATMRGLNVALNTLGKGQLAFDARGMLSQAGRLGIEILVVTVPDGKDPDDLIRDNPQAWQQLVDSAQPVVEYVMEMGTAHLTSNSTFGDREQVARELLPILLATENDLQTNYNIQRLALKLRLDERTLIQWASQHRRSLVKVKPTQPDEKPVGKLSVSNIPAMERYCLAILLGNSRLWSLANRKLREIAAEKGGGNAVLGPLSADDFLTSDYRVIIQLLEQELDQDEMDPVEYLERQLPADLRIEVEKLLSEPPTIIGPKPIRGMTEREREYIASTIMRDPEEFLKYVLELRRQRLLRENQELYFLQKDDEQAQQYLQKVATNKQALRLIDNMFAPVKPKNVIVKKGRGGPLPQKSYGKTS